MRKTNAISLLGLFVLASMLMSLDTVDYFIPKHVSRKLKRDAARIAIRMEARGEDLSLQKVEISSTKANAIYGLLTNIYEMGNIKSVRVFDCNIRAATNIAIDKFWIIYDKDASWAKSLNNGVYEADGKVGELFEDYDLFITEKKNWNERENIITIESAKLYNMMALAEKFKEKAGIVDVITQNSEMKPDSDIEVSFTEGYWNVSFVKKWSSLKNAKSHTWLFRIKKSTQKVEFVEEFGNDVPDWMSCQLLAGTN
ncbi:MAG: hypothetical protein ACI94Y_001721 [Maribacter sp.]